MSHDTHTNYHFAKKIAKPEHAKGKELRLQTSECNYHWHTIRKHGHCTVFGRNSGRFFTISRRFPSQKEFCSCFHARSFANYLVMRTLQVSHGSLIANNWESEKMLVSSFTFCSGYSGAKDELYDISLSLARSLTQFTSCSYPAHILTIYHLGLSYVP